jgi:dTDP-4-amino-4,6-dideoxygalactose transaminase
MTESVAFTDIKVDDEMVSRVEEALRSGRWVKGPLVEQFESAFADACDAEHAVAVNSGTDAIYLALKAAGIGDGDQVIVPSFTFFASASPVLELGAEPVFVDVDPLTYTMDVDHLSRAAERNDDVEAVVPVHLYGHPANMKGVRRVAHRHDLTVVEDACQAHGATYEGQPTGSLGDAGCFSFYPSKNMTVGGDGGIVTTDDAELARRAREYRNHGRNEDGEHVRLGLNHRLGELGAAFGLEQLSHLADWNGGRQEAAARYRDRLESLTEVRLPHERGDVDHVYHLYVIQTAERDALREHLEAAGIDTGIHYETPVHQTEAVQAELGVVPTLPRTERLVDRILSLPMHPRITDDEVDRVCDEIEAFYEGR